MDETEKYQRRQEAIAEKLRLQNEQDRVRREMEDEKIRLQQLKRKSLRDQWLMDGPVLSPTSPTSSFHLIDSTTQEKEEPTDMFSSNTDQMAEEKGKNPLREERVQETVTVTVAEKVSADLAIDMNRFQQDGVEVMSVANGGDSNNVCHKANGPCSNSEAVSSKAEAERGLGVPEVESHHASDLGFSSEEEGTLLIRAECVMITDEGDDCILASTQCKETQLPDQVVNGAEMVESELKTKMTPEKSPEQKPAPETLQPTEEFYLDANENKTDEIKGETPGKQSNDSSEEIHLPDMAVEDRVWASVPVYTEVEPSTISTATTEIEPLVLSVKDNDPAERPGLLQEVPLDVYKNNGGKEPRPEEHEPLLSSNKTSESAAVATADTSINVDPQNQETKSQEGEIKSPKWKSCRCCSVM